MEQIVWWKNSWSNFTYLPTELRIIRIIPIVIGGTNSGGMLVLPHMDFSSHHPTHLIVACLQKLFCECRYYGLRGWNQRSPCAVLCRIVICGWLIWFDVECLWAYNRNQIETADENPIIEFRFSKGSSNPRWLYYTGLCCVTKHNETSATYTLFILELHTNKNYKWIFENNVFH
jgi:hypothetical protein